VSAGGAFSRSDWKRQVSSGGSGASRWSKDGPSAGVDARRSTAAGPPRYNALLRQVASKDQARRRRDFVRQRCRRYGWEPFADTLTLTQTLISFDKDVEDHQNDGQTDRTSDTPPPATGIELELETSLT